MFFLKNDEIKESNDTIKKIETILEELAKLDLGPDDEVPEQFQNMFNLYKVPKDEIDKIMNDLDNIPTKKD